MSRTKVDDILLDAEKDSKAQARKYVDEEPSWGSLMDSKEECFIRAYMMGARFVAHKIKQDSNIKLEKPQKQELNINEPTSELISCP